MYVEYGLARRRPTQATLPAEHIAIRDAYLKIDTSSSAYSSDTITECKIPLRDSIPAPHTPPMSAPSYARPFSHLHSSPEAGMSEGQRAMIINCAMLKCKRAAHLAEEPPEARLSILQNALSEFLAETDKLHSGNMRYSLLDNKDANYTELDLFKAITDIASDQERAIMWKRMTDAYPVHERGPQSLTEHKQLASLFFHSAYVAGEHVNKRIEEVSSVVTANVRTGGTFRFVLARLDLITDPEEQIELFDRLLVRLEFADTHETLAATQMLCQHAPRLRDRMGAKYLVDYTLVIRDMLCFKEFRSIVSEIREALDNPSEPASESSLSGVST